MSEALRSEGLDSRFRAYCERYSLDPTTVEVAGVPLVIHPRVYRAEGASTTATLLEAIGEPHGATVLDMGCGTGVLGVIAALRGAERVVLADMSPDAVTNARANVALHGLEERCEVVESDLFERLGNQCFDLVIFNMPFLDGDGVIEFPVSESQQAAMPRPESFTDPGYRMIRRFMARLDAHMSESGRCLCSFASFGNHEALDSILEANALTRRTAARRAEPEYGLEYLAYELRRLGED
ncbi:MAG: methyltransferase [Myxococcota bacterium]